jgi:hypothetical protein
LITQISTPGVSGGTVGIISTVVANTVVHAVGTLSTLALTVVGASSYAFA